MKLYNTLSRTIETLHPLAPPKVTMYTCGPTVYDHLQIGNWTTFVRWDTLYRILKRSGLEPEWYMNITDVGHLVSDADEGEDKLERGAKREKKTAWQIAEFYTQDFLRGLDELNIAISRKHLPKATQHIEEQIALIETLEQKGYTYVIDDGVYFDTSKYADYGKLGDIPLDKLKPGARIKTNPQKRQPQDFALWKFSPKNHRRDMEWDSPWGKGFPGWHIECSAMSMKYLGPTIDIHGGGIDLIPTHHNGEIAQSEAATGKPFVRLWVHSHFLTVKGTKLSKSLHNSFTLEDIKKKGFEPRDFRLFVLQSHYRSEADFSWEALSAARNRLRNLQGMADLRFQITEGGGDLEAGMFKQAQAAIQAALEDDLNTPRALEIVSSLEGQLNAALVNAEAKAPFMDFLQALDDWFGLGLLASDDLSTAQKALVEKREQARAAKDWQTADEMRAKLHEEGIEIRDTAHKPIWSRL